jgi:uncharacterized protein
VILSRGVAETDPLAGALVPGALVGLLVPDLAARRRMRINGRIAAGEAGTMVVRAEQVYANCPQYIQPRESGAEARLSGGPAVTRGRSLSERQRDVIRRADTFLIATANPAEGLDASHRGGPPGFVEVAGDTLSWPDYAGNAMFNTLGNIALYPRAGIVVPDFQTGAVLQLAGTAVIEWTGQPGRSVRLSIDAVVESAPRDPI